MTYFNCHAHTMYSNLRLLDCINRPEALIKTSKDLGLSGLAITDHETLSSHMTVNKIAKVIRETDPDFTIALGNEVYLTDTREPKQKYYHFIFIAKDEIGYKQLKELSTIAWDNLYKTGKMERVPILKSEVQEIISKNPGHIIATSACIGGELSSNALQMSLYEKVNDISNAEIYYQNIKSFLKYCLDLFGEDFYIECAPSTDNDQIIVNQKLYKISQAYNIPMVVGTDAHYLRPEDRMIHKAYLTSKEGERETDKFYAYTYVMSPDEAKTLLMESFPEDVVDWLFANSLDLQKKINWFSLERKQIIPKVDLPYIEKFDFTDKYPILKSLANSNELQERYWLSECCAAMKVKGFTDKEEYWQRLETEADVIKCIGEIR